MRGERGRETIPELDGASRIGLGSWSRHDALPRAEPSANTAADSPAAKAIEAQLDEDEEERESLMIAKSSQRALTGTLCWRLARKDTPCPLSRARRASPHWNDCFGRSFPSNSPPQQLLRVSAGAENVPARFFPSTLSLSLLVWSVHIRLPLSNLVFSFLLLLALS